MQIEQTIYHRPSLKRDESSDQIRRRALSQELVNVLDYVDAIFIKQKFEALEVLTQFETENAYFIFSADPETQEPQKRILTAYEKSNVFVRNVMPENYHSFQMDVKDIASGKNLVFIKRPFKFTFLCWGRPIITVHDYQNDNEQIGLITSPFNCCQDQKFIIQDSEENLLYTIVGNCCQCSLWCNLPCNKCQTTQFIIKDYEGEEVGYMQKKSSGFFKSLVSDCDNYFIKFPSHAPPSHKYLLLFSAIFIDYWLFEGKVSGQKGK